MATSGSGSGVVGYNVQVAVDSSSMIRHVGGDLLRDFGARASSSTAIVLFVASLV
jgi:hypothetical protein